LRNFQYMEKMFGIKTQLPVIMLTARRAEADRVRALETGAGDLVLKPFCMTELMARIDAVLRRSSPAPLTIGCWSSSWRHLDGCIRAKPFSTRCGVARRRSESVRSMSTSAGCAGLY
jgi:DNA-binding response OmpR family regulator